MDLRQSPVREFDVEQACLPRAHVYRKARFPCKTGLRIHYARYGCLYDFVQSGAGVGIDVVLTSAMSITSLGFIDRHQQAVSRPLVSVFQTRMATLS